MMPYKQITLAERKVIQKMLNRDMKNAEIARLLGYHRSTVKREIDRNREKYWYRAEIAQKRSEERKRRSRTRKIEHSVLREYIINGLSKFYSPEQIAGRLKLEYPNDDTMRVSHESIYTWIYNDARNNGELYQFLRRQVKKRKRRLNKKHRRIQIPNRKSIHTRPMEAEERSEIGHWEGDTLHGAGRSGYLVSFTERKSMYQISFPMADKRPSTLIRASFEAFGDIPNSLIQTITVDNGTEFFEFKTLEEAFECEVYFADPYSAWQRGLNENTNGLLRQFFPKRMRFDTFDENRVDMVISMLNHRPRKRLGYRTPYEVFYGLNVAVEN